MNSLQRWILVAAGLHALIAWWLFDVPLRPRVEPQRVVAVKLFQPRSVGPVAKSLTQRPGHVSGEGHGRRRGRAQSRVAAQAVAVPGGADPSVDSDDDDAQAHAGANPEAGSYARELSVPSLGRTAATVPALRLARPATDLERAEAMLADLKLASKLESAARGGARGVLVDVKRHLEHDFMPSNSAVAAVLAGNARPTKGPPSTRRIREDRIHDALSPAVAQHTVAMGSIDQSFILFELIALVRLQHRPGDGAVESAAVQQSSGVAAFDREAMAAAARAVGTKLLERPGEPLPEWSDWRFQQTVYKYGAGARAMDPAFRPPGKPDAEHGVWVDAELHFVTALYRP